MSDIKAKLESLKTLKGEMKDWKKDDLRKKKGVKEPEPVTQESKSGEHQAPEEESVLAKLIQKLVESK